MTTIGQRLSPAAALPLRRLKRLTDIGFSLTALLLLSPLLIAVVAAALIEQLLSRRARGPLLYREHRVSRGVVFEILKFRIVVAASIEEARQCGEPWSLRQLEDDPGNLTTCGRYLKKWYLDELPQLVNVLRGDMSLVGPRPWAVKEYREQLARGEDTKGLVPCGLFGPVQAAKGTAYDTVALETDYIESYRAMGTLALFRHDVANVYRGLRVLREGKGI